MVQTQSRKEYFEIYLEKITSVHYEWVSVPENEAVVVQMKQLWKCMSNDIFSVLCVILLQNRYTDEEFESVKLLLFSYLVAMENMTNRIHKSPKDANEDQIQEEILTGFDIVFNVLASNIQHVNGTTSRTDELNVFQNYPDVSRILVDPLSRTPEENEDDEHDDEMDLALQETLVDLKKSVIDALFVTNMAMIALAVIPLAMFLYNITQ